MNRFVAFGMPVVLSAGLLVGCGSSDGSDDEPDPYEDARQLCVDLTNGYRDQVGVPHLSRNTAKESCVDSQCESDSQGGQAHGAFGQCGEHAQNECPGWPSEDIEGSVKKCLQMMFDEGPGEPYSAHGHYINMTSTKYSKVACGFYVTKSGKLWVIQDFY